MLSVQGLRFHYRPDQPVLRDVSFKLAPGQALGLLGPNGTGKTTLLRCLLGLLKPLGGQIILGDRNLARLGLRERAGLMAYVPQSSALTFPYEVMEVVMMGRLPHFGLGRSPNAEDRREAEAALEEMDIAHLAGRLFQRLSGGEKQLVLIARALAQRASLLVLDEPTANLDFFNQVRTMKLIRALTGRGRTVLLTTHSPDQALLIADQAVLIKDGLVLADGHPDQAITTQSLSALYGLSAVVETTSVFSAGRPVKVCIPVMDREASGE